METVTDTAILEKLIQSEAGQAAKTAIERDHTAMRMNLKAQAETLRRERGQRKRELADATQAAHSRMTAARKALTSAETEHQQAAMELAQAQSSFDSRIAKLKRELRATAPATISQFIEWLGDEEDTCKATAIVENAAPTDKISTSTSAVIKKYFSNARSLSARLTAIRAARQKAEALKDKVLDNTDIELRLQELRDSLPPVVMAFSHEK